jgi:hypothetical protein
MRLALSGLSQSVLMSVLVEDLRIWWGGVDGITFGAGFVKPRCWIGLVCLSFSFLWLGVMYTYRRHRDTFYIRKAT